jgi:hypothetical protein
MEPIKTYGLACPTSVSAGEFPELRWVAIGDLFAASQANGELDAPTSLSIKQMVDTFNWSCFTPVVVTPTEEGKFVIIDGFRRVTAAAIVGFDAVPCQIVIADDRQLAVAYTVLNGGSRPSSRMATHAANLTYREPSALRLSQLCERAGIELLRYPVPINRQAPGQTMAIAAMSQCLTRYGEATLITALHCVTQTTNNQPGLLTGRMIKALCVVLDGDHDLRDRGLALLDAFDSIDLAAIQDEASKESEKNKGRRIYLIAEQIRAELAGLLHSRATIAPALPTPREKIFAASPRAKAASPKSTRPGTGRGRPQMLD